MLGPDFAELPYDGGPNWAAKNAATRSITLLFFDAGGGHRSAATALRDVMRDQYPGWHVELVDLFSDILRPLDPVHRLTGVYRTEDVYNGLLKSGLTYGFPIILRGIHKLIAHYAPQIETRLRHYWRTKARPDLVVSLLPHFNAPLFDTLQDIFPHVPFVTVMTDLADCPPHFWQERQDQYIVCGSDRAVYQARVACYRPERVFKTSGMILKPHFYREQKTFNREGERIALGLDPERITALIMFGGHGANMATRIVDRLGRIKPPIQCLVMCGHNRRLRESLANRLGCHAVGFTDDVPHYMRLADFFIGKPGPGSLSEALHMGLPVIIERSARTMPQERYNTRWVEEHELGVVIKSYTRISQAVRFLLEEGRLEKFRHNARQFKNNAVYEIPELFEQIMTQEPDLVNG
jgi:1,2-diacylglycerol 3-beta-galactosyltransferase